MPAQHRPSARWVFDRDDIEADRGGAESTVAVQRTGESNQMAALRGVDRLFRGGSPSGAASANFDDDVHAARVERQQVRFIVTNKEIARENAMPVPPEKPRGVALRPAPPPMTGIAAESSKHSQKTRDPHRAQRTARTVRGAIAGANNVSCCMRLSSYAGP